MNCGGDLPNVRRVRAELGRDRAVSIARGLLIALSACGAALVIGAAARFWLEPSATAVNRAATRGKADPRAQARQGPLDYAVIFERNLFGSEPISDTSTAAGPRDELLLRGTAEFGGRGYAVLEDPDSGKQGIFEVGEMVFDGPRLIEVAPRTATILRGNRRVVRELTETTRGVEAGAEDSGGTAGGGGIRQVGDHRYVVDRGEVDHSIENLSQVVTQMRAVPYLKDGKSVGFRVFNIRAGSLFERMGLKNGDIIQAVNGSDLDDPSRALALLDEVQTSDEIRIDLLRDDHPNTLTYSIR